MKKSSSLLATTIRLTFAGTLAFLATTSLAGCGSDAKGAATSCMSLCTTAGFTGSMVDEAAHETNCFCTGGTGTVTAAACTTMCTGLGKSTSQAFKSGAGVTTENACQCS